MEGKETGAKRHAVCLNAGAALYIAGKAASIEAGVKMAEQLIDSGTALKKLEEFIEKSNQEWKTNTNNNKNNNNHITKQNNTEKNNNITHLDKDDDKREWHHREFYRR